MISRVGITWQLSEYFGWGIFGFNIAKVLQNHPSKKALLLCPSKPQLTDKSLAEIKPLLKAWEDLIPSITQAQKENKRMVIKDTVLIHGLGNNFAFASGNPPIVGSKNIGFIFFESTHLSYSGMRRAHSLDAVFAGSRWNAELLRGAGIKNVGYVMQGVDIDRYQKVKRSQKYKDRFVIFSGGKLEYRKGQDIVVKAFDIFKKKHPEALLLTMWGNKWPQITKDLIQSPHQLGVPNILPDQSVDVAEWTKRAGIDEADTIHHGFMPNSELHHIYADVDVALFPNRAEGGTNLVAMELMACGVPCILSANTGHFDLIDSGRCYPLEKQSRIAGESREGWGESDIDEILEKLEQAFSDRQKAHEIGVAGQKFIAEFSWENQAKQLVNLIDGVL